jgi:hypothetical protein
MTVQRNSLVALTIALLLGTAAFGGAQEPGPPQEPEPPQEQQQPSERPMMEGKMSMDDMMKGCREHCEQTSSSIDKMATSMKEARESNDPAKMRQALEDAREPLEEMRDHMRMCTNMMGMMQKMHGEKAPR